MKKLFVAAVFSVTLLSVARAEEARTAAGNAMLEGDAMKSGEYAAQGGTGSAGGMAADSTGTSGKQAKEEKVSEMKAQDDGTKSTGSMHQDDRMDPGTTK